MGVWWSARLRVVPLDENAAAQKGIKRGADKVHHLCCLQYYLHTNEASCGAHASEWCLWMRMLLHRRASHVS